MIYANLVDCDVYVSLKETATVFVNGAPQNVDAVIGRVEFVGEGHMQLNVSTVVELFEDNDPALFEDDDGMGLTLSLADVALVQLLSDNSEGDDGGDEEGAEVEEMDDEEDADDAEDTPDDDDPLEIGLETAAVSVTVSLVEDPDVEDGIRVLVHHENGGRNPPVTVRLTAGKGRAKEIWSGAH